MFVGIVEGWFKNGAQDQKERSNWSKCVLKKKLFIEKEGRSTMAYSQILRSDLQDLLDQYRKIRDEFSALYNFSEKQEKSLEAERERSRMLQYRLNRVLCLLMSREENHKISLDKLKKENKQLHNIIATTQRECERDKFLNNDKVSKLQVENDFLHMQMIQLEEKHRQQLISQNKRHEDEILECKRHLGNVDMKLLMKQHVVVEKFQGTKNRSKVHPAFINEENVEKKKNRVGKLPGLEIVRVEKVARKRRKLFLNDEETVVDI
ncbi:meiosis-specific nuclear structural protein 1-like [Nylanderia fulva]|uniref:meiosis-specific nuclear structural protein 1-like n=1 Tax=Nylanderia fulva TaxID=613905 RepID=UPI0010FADA25|nr:meiosis-specific nuclear structural protein 1-like [Nylanderia fulva]